MNFDDFMNSTFNNIPHYGVLAIEKTPIEELHDVKQYKMQKEHSFMEDAFEEFELIREEKGVFSAALFMHEKYKALHADRAKSQLLK